MMIRRAQLGCGPRRNFVGNIAPLRRVGSGDGAIAAAREKNSFLLRPYRVWRGPQNDSEPACRARAPAERGTGDYARHQAGTA
jgi:hypothetical protein